MYRSSTSILLKHKMHSAINDYLPTNTHMFYIFFSIVVSLICDAAHYEMRIDLLSPCRENDNNSARFGPLDVLKLNQNRFKLNGTLIVNETIEGRLEVSFHYCSLFPNT